MKKITDTKLITITIILFFIVIFSLMVSLRGSTILGQNRIYTPISSKVPGYTQEEIEEQILLGNKDKIEEKRVYIYKDIEITKDNFYIFKDRKLLGKNLRIETSRHPSYPKIYLPINDKNTLNAVNKLKENEKLILTFSERKGTDRLPELYYSLKGKEQILGDFAYILYKISFETFLISTLLFGVFSFIIEERGLVGDGY